MLPVMLLPTPAVNDMGEGKTPEAWDEWTAKMQASHANGNGNGKSLAIEAMRLLPTPKSTNNENRQSLDRYGMNLGMALDELVGATTNPRSADGNASSGDQPPHPPSPAEPETRSSRRPSSSS
jgi:hypothetical protein